MTDTFTRLFRRGAFGAAVALALTAMPVGTPAQSELPDTEHAMPVSVLKVHIQDSYTALRGFTGRAVARRSADLGFESGGKLADVRVDAGDRVAEGEQLASLDTQRLEARRRELRAELAEAQANLELARKTRKRSAELFERGHLPEQRLDEAVAEQDAAQARLERVRAALNSIAVDLDKAVLTAPFGGVIERRLADEGTVLATGTPVLRLIESDALEAEVGLPLAFAETMRAGDAVPLKTQGGDLVFARVKAKVPAVRGETRTALVTLTIDGEAQAAIADGALVTAELSETVDTSGFWLPLRALTADVRGLWRVYKVVEGKDGANRVVFENVQILHSEGDRAFVSGTVKDGDLVIEGGVARVVPGKRVEIVRMDGRQVAGLSR